MSYFQPFKSHDNKATHLCELCHDRLRLVSGVASSNAENQFTKKRHKEELDFAMDINLAWLVLLEQLPLGKKIKIKRIKLFEERLEKVYQKQLKQLKPSKN